MNTIRFTSKALFVALLSTGLLAPMVKAEGTSVETFTGDQMVLTQPATEAKTVFGKVCDFAKDNVKAAGIGAVVGTAATIVVPVTAKKAFNFVKEANWKKRTAVATGAVAAAAATVGGLWYANYLPTFETVKSIPSAMLTFVKDNKIQTAVGAGAAVVASAITSGVKSKLTSTKKETPEFTHKPDGKKSEDPANCNDGKCRRPSDTKRPKNGNPYSAPTAKAQQTGRHYVAQLDGTFKEVQKGSVKATGNPNFFCESELPKNAVVINLQ